MNNYKVNDYVVVPLAHPSGVYIRVDNNKYKVPVLAKVIKTFDASINVINYFGYIYTTC